MPNERIEIIGQALGACSSVDCGYDHVLSKCSMFIFDSKRLCRDLIKRKINLRTGCADCKVHHVNYACRINYESTTNGPDMFSCHVTAVIDLKLL